MRTLWLQAVHQHHGDMRAASKAYRSSLRQSNAKVIAFKISQGKMSELVGKDNGEDVRQNNDVREASPVFRVTVSPVRGKAFLEVTSGMMHSVWQWIRNNSHVFISVGRRGRSLVLPTTLPQSARMIVHLPPPSAPVPADHAKIAFLGIPEFSYELMFTVHIVDTDTAKRKRASPAPDSVGVVGAGKGAWR